MKTVYTARGLKIHGALRDVVEPKLAKLEKVLPRGAKVRGRRPAREEGDLRRGDGRGPLAHLEGGRRAARPADRRAGGHGPDRGAGEEVEGHREGGEEALHDLGAAARGLAGGGAARRARPDAFRREAVTARAMFEEDALTAFGASARDVLVFRDLGAGEVLRVLYRRKDGGVALVTPD